MKVFMTIITAIMIIVQTKTYKVSWYGGFHHGRKTASGEVFDKNKLTCAAVSTYKLGSYLEVTNPKNGKSVVVKVNDRGGFAKYGRELDLSEAAFKKITSINQGVTSVTIKKL